MKEFKYMTYISYISAMKFRRKARNVYGVGVITLGTIISYIFIQLFRLIMILSCKIQTQDQVQLPDLFSNVARFELNLLIQEFRSIINSVLFVGSIH